MGIMIDLNDIRMQEIRDVMITLQLNQTDKL
jgi:hypothetical protein